VAPLVAASAMLLPLPAGATLFTASGTSSVSGAPLSASADFSIAGDVLTITLTNTSLADVLVQADVLTSVFFDVTGDVALIPVSVVLGGGSAVLFGGSDPGGVVGGEWAYASALSGAPGGRLQGISSSGFDLFGGATFPGTNLQGPAAIDGIQYGITSAGDDPTTGQSAVTGTRALIQSQVVVTLSGASGLTMSDISHVGFQYGTALTPTDPFLPGVPEPTTALLLAGGLAGLALRRRGRGSS
jgi:PEP-CTERM motif